MRQYKAIIFDLDGVVINTEPLHARAKRMAFEHYGVDVPEDMYAEFRGRADRDMVEGVVEQFGPPSLEWKKVLARKDELFNELEHEIELIPGVADFIALARQHFEKLAMVTSATRRNQEYALRRFGLESFFDVVVTANETTRTKPDPEPYLTALSKLAIEPELCLVVEDSTHGIAAANAAGCEVVAITTSFSSDELAKANPRHIVGSYKELTSLLDLQTNVEP